jgi:hypothetical protein
LFKPNPPSFQEQKLPNLNFKSAYPNIHFNHLDVLVVNVFEHNINMQKNLSLRNKKHTELCGYALDKYTSYSFNTTNSHIKAQIANPVHGKHVLFSKRKHDLLPCRSSNLREVLLAVAHERLHSLLRPAPAAC